MLKLVSGIIGGLLLAFALVFAADALFHALAPTAVRPAAGDAEAMRAYVARQPVGALAGILAGWTLGVFAGSGLAARIAERGEWPGWVVTGLFLLATAGNFLMIPHPVWMVLAAIVLILAGGWFGAYRFARGRNRVRAA